MMPKLLIVDDEVKIREVVKEYAKLSGYEVSEASDGVEALDLFQEEHFVSYLEPQLYG